MDKNKLMLMLAALAIAIGTAIAARSMLTAGGQAAAPVVQAALPILPKGPRVLVAQRALPPGTIITPDAMTFQEWPNSLVKNAYFLDGKTDMSKLVGTVVRFPITAGQPLTQGALVAPGDRGFLAAALGPGMRAVTITVSVRGGVAGFVFPGDRVDVMLTQTLRANGGGTQALSATETILRNLRVLATDQSTSKENADGKTIVQTFTTVTLEVTPKIAEKIEVAQAVGTLSLTLRPLAENQADLDRAIANGALTADAKAGDTKAGKGFEERAMAFATKRPIDTGASLTTGGEVSRFQMRTISAVAPQGPASVASAPTGPFTPNHGVRVTRGKETQSIEPSAAMRPSQGMTGAPSGDSFGAPSAPTAN